MNDALKACSVLAGLILMVNSAHGIVGGEKPTPASLSTSTTVALLGPFGDLCSGVVIHRKALLTSAHCFHRGKDSITVVFTSDITAALRDPKATRAMRPLALHVYEGFAWLGLKTTNQNDLTIVELPEEVPANYHPAELPSSALDLGAGAQVRVAGFGLQNRFAHSVEGEPMELLEKSLFIEAIAANIGVVEQNDGGLCSGDSGGPVFANGILLGINWKVFTEDPDKGLCENYGAFIRIDDKLDWIMEILGKL